jgi:peptidoglycan/LPS O-acetylase OafA/YrhL
LKYRAEIDGLRALAVVPVILFHAGFELFSGGFVGVDVFFVISGYLITTILIEDIENKRFSIVNFYERRARRILPALFFVMLVCLPFAWMWMLPSQMKDFSQSLVAVSLFASNILFWRESGYFAAAAEEKPLLHTWSLAVEEQYYVLFPIFLILAWRFGKNRVFWMIVVMAAISLLLSEWGWRNKATANFYLAPTRAWELFSGSIAAFVVQKYGVQKNNLLSLVGLVAIIFSIFFYDEATPFPSIYALVPVLGVVLLVLYANKETIAAKLLSTKGFVGIGLISYSAYLWHQPLFAFARIRSLEYPSLLLFSLLSLTSLVLAYFSWRYVEKPFRDKNAISRTQIFSISLVLITSFSAAGLGGYFYHNQFESIWLERQTPEVRSIYEVLNKENPSTSNWGAKSETIQEIGSCVFNVRELSSDVETRIVECREQHGKGLLVLGDSHAIDLFGVIASREEQSFLIGVTQGFCRPHNNHSYCHYDRVLQFITENPELFGLVIYEQAGFHLLRKNNGAKGSRVMFYSLGITEPVANIIVDEENIRLTLGYLNQVSEVVNVNWFLPRAEPHITKNMILKYGCNFEYSYRPNLYETFIALDNYIEGAINSYSNDRLKTVSQNEMFQFNFPSDFLSCNTLYWSDGDHLSASGEEYFGRRVTQELF